MAQAPAGNPRDTPAMRQYARFKQRHPECLLFFRVGDFYELFDDDAVTASRALGLTLTQRTAGVPMAGVPHHQLENYLRRLIAQGFRVAIADQVQEASQAKGIIERAVTRVLTPGTLVDEQLLEDDRSSALAAVVPASPVSVLAVADLSTGAFTLLACEAGALADELARRHVREVIYSDALTHADPARAAVLERAIATLGLAATPQPAWVFRLDQARAALCEQFGVATLAGFGLRDDEALIMPAGAIVRYLLRTQAPDAGGGEGAGAAAAASTSPPNRPSSPSGPSRPSRLAHLRPPRREEAGEHLVLDAASLRALEVDRTLRGGRDSGPGPGGAGASSAGDGSLVGVFLGAGVGRGTPRSAMGRRLLRDWLCRPLARRPLIEARLAVVRAAVEDRRLADDLGASLAGLHDVPRIASRLALGRASPRDLVGLGRSLLRVAGLRDACANTPALAALEARFEGVRAAAQAFGEQVTRVCVDEPPAHLRDGGLVRPGVDAELDEARSLQTDADAWLAAYQQRLIAEHQLPTLKVGYNRIFGYYIELSKPASARAPSAFARRQTLTGAERFVTPELREFEERVSQAHARALRREQQLFDALLGAGAALLPQVAEFAAAAAELDALLAFADKAWTRRWIEPVLSDEPLLNITQGRHPVLADRGASPGGAARSAPGLAAAGGPATSAAGGSFAPGAGGGGDFVPNDARLGVADPARGGSAAPRLALITGPNMAGKSTFIRQTALLVLLAHAGSFVPAEAAVIGLTDRILTRVGADDALHAGQSTFMVEMTETAAILHHATARSLVILDEIGRGTGTLDGLSLAWAITEALAGDDGAPGPRTLFATHYHELTRLQDRRPDRVANLHVAVQEWPGPDGLPRIIFLHRILPGRTDRSYGLHVAQLAGVPERVVRRAARVMESLSVEHTGAGDGADAADADAPGLDAARILPSTRRVPPAPGEAGAARRHDEQGQLALFTEYLHHPAVETLRTLNLERLSPIDAFDALRRLKALTDADA